MEMNYECCEDCMCYVCGNGVTAKKCPQWKWEQCLTNVTCGVVGARFCNDEPHCQNDPFPCGMSGIPHCYADLNKGEWRQQWLGVRTNFHSTKSSARTKFKISMPSMEKWNAYTLSIGKRHPRNMCMEKAFQSVGITRFAIDEHNKDIMLNAALCDLCCCIVCDELASKCPQWNYHGAVKRNGGKKIESEDLQSLPHCLATDLGRSRSIWQILQELTATKNELEQVMKENSLKSVCKCD